MLIKEDRLRTIIREGLITLHGFSVDGMKPATVEAIRVNAKLDVILENIGMLLALRKSESKLEPGIVIRYALMRSNIEELPAAVEYWGKMGIDRLDTGYLSVCNGIDHNESLYFHQDLMKKVFGEARAIAQHYPKLNLRLPRTVEEELSLQSNPSRCTAPWSFVNIDTDGRVLPCYRAFEALSMGNVYDDDGEAFESIWNSKPYQLLRRTVNDDSGTKHFTYCSRCEYRYGWGDVAPHVGDDTWIKLVSISAPDKAQAIDHRRRKAKATTKAS
jgi:radical SAM protein with 4Fe4S-binding SPASM domain